MKSGIKLIAEERQRQIEEEGWDEKHDDQHIDQSLLKAAACYILPDGIDAIHLTRDSYDRESELRKELVSGRLIWPWDNSSDKRKKHDKIKQLSIAGALIAAEIDRKLRELNEPG